MIVRTMDHGNATDDEVIGMSEESDNDDDKYDDDEDDGEHEDPWSRMVSVKYLNCTRIRWKRDTNN